MPLIAAVLQDLQVVEASGQIGGRPVAGGHPCGTAAGPTTASALEHTVQHREGYQEAQEAVESVKATEPWRHVLPQDALRAAAGRVITSAALRYVERRLTAKEAAAKERLRELLAADERVSITVSGLQGPGSPANGTYEACDEVLAGGERCFRHTAGTAFVHRAGPAVWCISPHPTSEIAEECWAHIPSSTPKPPRGRWATTRQSCGDFAWVAVSAERLLSKFFRPEHAITLSDEQCQVAMRQIDNIPKLLMQVMHETGVSVVELQKVLLPDFRPNASFPSKTKCFQALAAWPAVQDSCMGDLDGLNVSTPQANGIPAQEYKVARWLELLDGTTHVRLMTSLPPLPPTGTCFLADSALVGALLRGLRQLQWTPRLHPAFPARCRGYIDALIALGQSAGFERPDVWEHSVLPFVCQGVLAGPGEVAAWRRQGEVLECYSTSEDQWNTGTVLRVEPISGGMQVSCLPGRWLTRKQQARLTRVPAAGSTS